MSKRTCALGYVFVVMLLASSTAHAQLSGLRGKIADRAATASVAPAGAANVGPAAAGNAIGQRRPEGRDAILDWNAILLQANAEDHSGTFGPPDQGGPCKTARAFAIVHAAMFDAANSIERQFEPFLTSQRALGASLDAAVAQAAHDCLVELYPAQADVFDAALDAYLADDRRDGNVRRGRKLGEDVAALILELRSADGSDVDPFYEEGFFPGEHRQDPLNPNQGFLNPGWGSTLPFVMTSGAEFRAPPFPELDSAEYTANFNDVKVFGGDGVITPTARTEEQTEIGLYWAYDGAIGLGTPPRLYNQIARLVAAQQGNTELDNARLFALLNIAQADAGCCAWETKYAYNIWRPVLGIREADVGTGPTGLGDFNPDTAGDVNWTPLGAPRSNGGGIAFTPPFPAYTSGHATFGAASFTILARFFGTDNITFTFVSDELNGMTTAGDGVTVRPLRPRTFNSFSQAALENARSRVYLGVHWQADADLGVAAGNFVGDLVFDSVLQPLN